MSICCKKERIAWIDIAKAIAIFFIVLGHQLPSGPLCGYLYSFHVPLFFFLSGLTFNTAKEPKNFFPRKSKKNFDSVFYFFINKHWILYNYELFFQKKRTVSYSMPARNDHRYTFNRTYAVEQSSLVSPLFVCFALCSLYYKQVCFSRQK